MTIHANTRRTPCDHSPSAMFLIYGNALVVQIKIKFIGQAIQRLFIYFEWNGERKICLPPPGFEPGTLGLRAKQSADTFYIVTYDTEMKILSTRISIKNKTSWVSYRRKHFILGDRTLFHSAWISGMRPKELYILWCNMWEKENWYISKVNGWACLALKRNKII